MNIIYYRVEYIFVYTDTQNVHKSLLNKLKRVFCVFYVILTALFYLILVFC
jgi:hypothetical protein